tara:strand:- start:737 stop:1585 length:849 start_codon:yes stop_codon:yes gene_type:complete
MANANSVIRQSVLAYLGNADDPEISNPIHSTELALSYGFSGPLIAGVTVWGWATDCILEALGESWLKFGWSEFSLKQPTYPGETLEISVFKSTEGPSGSYEVEIRKSDNSICVKGLVGLGKTDWSADLIKPDITDSSFIRENKEPLLLGEEKNTTPWTPMQISFSMDNLTEFLNEKQKTSNPIFAGPNPIAHPSWIAGWAENLMRHNFLLPSSMHTRSKIQHLNSIPINTNVVARGHIKETYERKGHHFVNFDVSLSDDSDQILSQMSHWTIFKIATLEERG